MAVLKHTRRSSRLPKAGEDPLDLDSVCFEGFSCLGSGSDLFSCLGGAGELESSLVFVVSVFSGPG